MHHVGLQLVYIKKLIKSCPILSISIRAFNCKNMLYFSIEVQNQCIIRASNCKIFYNCATITFYMYDGTIAQLYNF